MVTTIWTKQNQKLQQGKELNVRHLGCTQDLLGSSRASPAPPSAAHPACLLSLGGLYSTTAADLGHPSYWHLQSAGVSRYKYLLLGCVHGVKPQLLCMIPFNSEPLTATEASPGLSQCQTSISLSRLQNQYHYQVRLPGSSTIWSASETQLLCADSRISP